MGTVGADLDLVQARLHDGGTIWPRAELLRFFNDGYRQILAGSGAFSRLLPLDVPGRHSYAVSQSWETRHTSGGTWWFPMLTCYGGTRAATAAWEVEQLDGVTPSEAYVGITMQWERAHTSETDRHFQFGLPTDDERVRRLEWNNKVLHPMSVREFDEVDDAWMRRVGEPNWWTVGVGAVRSVEVYEIDTAYQQAYDLMDSTRGIPREPSGDRTYSIEVDSYNPSNSYAYTTQADAEALTVPGMAFVTASAYTHTWEASEALTTPAYNFTINLTMNYPSLLYVFVHPWESGDVGGPGITDTLAPELADSLRTSQAAWYRFGLNVRDNEWDDATGQGRDLLQATGTNRPTKQADSSILFDGVNDFLKAVAFTLNQPESIYILFQALSWTSADRVFDGNALNTGALHQASFTPDLSMNAGTDAALSNMDLPLNTYGVVSVVFNGASSILQVNNEIASTADAGLGNMSGCTLGTDGANAGLNGHIQVKEVLIYSAAHDATTRSQIVEYLLAINRWTARRGTFALEADPNEAYESQVMLSDNRPVLSGMGSRFTKAPTTKSNGFYVFTWEGQQLNGSTVTTQTTGGVLGMFPWELEFGTSTLTFGLGGVRSVSSPDRQYVPMVSEAAPLAMLGGIRDWRSSTDNLMAMEVVIPPVDLGETDTPVLIPGPIQKYLRFYTWSRAFGREGEGQRLDLAAHYDARFQRGVSLLKRFADTSHADRTFARQDDSMQRTRPPLVRLPATFERQW